MVRNVSRMRARFDAALAEMRRALKLNPLSLVIQTGIGRILHFAGRFAEAAESIRARDHNQPCVRPGPIDLALTRMAQEISRRHARSSISRELFARRRPSCCCAGALAVRDPSWTRAEAFTVMRERYDQGTAGADNLSLMAAGSWETVLPR